MVAVAVAVEIAVPTGLSTRELERIQRLVEKRHGQIVRSWNAHFGRGS